MTLLPTLFETQFFFKRYLHFLTMAILEVHLNQFLKIHFHHFQGAWRDRDTQSWDQLSKETRDSMDFREDNDGEFWIAFEDIIENFDGVYFSHLSPDTFAPSMFSRNRSRAMDRKKFEWGEKQFSG